jgi:hypothetical protein
VPYHVSEYRASGGGAMEQWSSRELNTPVLHHSTKKDRPPTMEDREPTLLLAKKSAIKALAELSPDSDDDLPSNSRRNSSGSFASPALANTKTVWFSDASVFRNSTADRNEPKLSQNFGKFATAFPDQIFSEMI